MIKDLVKLANSLDEIGLNKYSDRIDATIEKLKKEAQDSSVAPEGSTAWQWAGDVLRSGYLSPFLGAAQVPMAGVEAAKSLWDGKGTYESLMPNWLKSVEGFMGRKDPLLASAKSSFDIDSAKESSKYQDADTLKKEIRGLVEPMDYWFGGSWTIANYYRGLEKNSPKLYSLSWSLGFSGSTPLDRSEVGLASVIDNLSSSTSSLLSTDYREAGRWIMWQLIKKGFEDGAEERKRASAPVSPPAPGPSPAPPSPPIVGGGLIAIQHDPRTVLQDGDYRYIINKPFSFNWSRTSDEKEGVFTPTTSSEQAWNKAATIINSLSPVKSGEGKEGEVVTQPGLTAPVAPSADNSLANVEIILARTNAGATFAIGTLQNEMARLRRLIEGGMSIPDIAKEIVMQNGDALTKSSLASAKPDDLNKMSNGDIKRAYRTEVDLIMSTINRIFRAQK